MSIIDDILSWINSALQPYADIPNSTLFILAVSAAVTAATSITNRLLIDVERLKAASREMAAWRRELVKARKTGDKQLLAKAMKKEKAMRQLQLRMSTDQMKVMFIFLIPLMLLWYILGGFFGSRIVAHSPFPIPLVGEGLLFAHWYIISSFAISLPLTRILGLRPEEG